MLTALVIVTALGIASLWSVFYLFVRCVRGIEDRTREDLAAAVRGILVPAAEGQPSALAVYSDQVATLFAARIVQQLKTAAGGVASGVSKEAESAAIAQVAGGSPWMALLAGLLPKKFRSQILAAPQFAGQLRLPDGGNGQQPTASVADRLKHQR